MSKDNNETDKPHISEGYTAIEVPKGISVTPELPKSPDAPTPIVEDVTLEQATEGEQEEQGVEIDLKSGEVIEPQEEATEAPKKAPTQPKKAAVKEEEPDTKAAPKKQEDKRPSRAKKRIKQLHTDKQTLQAELAEARQQTANLQAQLQQGSQESKETLKVSLEANMVNLTKGMQEAIESGDSEEAVRLSVETTNAQMQLAGLTSELQTIEKAKEQVKAEPAQKQQQQTSDVPEKALDWIEEHPEFNSDTLFHVSALTISNQLVGEGFDDHSDEFYEELENRLSPRFPEVFGTDGENGVNYTQDDKNASNGAEDGNEQASQARDEKGTQTVSGSSRTPPHKKGSKGRGSNSVVLSPKDVAQAERWGLSLEQIARRVDHNEKNRRDDGYVVIEMKKS